MSVEIVFPPSSEKFVRLQCNGEKSRYIHPSEVDFIDSYLQRLSPRCVLDLGCGLGRIGIYLFKRYEWKDARFVMADGDSGEVQLANLRTGKSDFYNSMATTEEFCRANGMENVEFLNLEKQGWDAMKSAPDLVVSFYAFGFHWPIEYCLDAIYPYIEKSCLLLFGMRTDLIDDYKKWNNEQMKNIDKSKYKIIDFIFDSAMGSLVLESL